MHLVLEANWIRWPRIVALCAAQLMLGVDKVLAYGLFNLGEYNMSLSRKALRRYVVCVSFVPKSDKQICTREWSDHLFWSRCDKVKT